MIVRCLEKVFKNCNFNLNDPDPSLVAENAEILSQCLFGLALGFDCAQCLGTIKQALDHGLIRLLACCSMKCIYSKLSKEGRTSLRLILSRGPGDIVVIRSIVLASQRAMANDSTVLNKMGNLVLSEVYPSVMSSCIKEVWEELFRRLSHQTCAPQVIAKERYVCVWKCECNTCLIKISAF